MAIVSKESASIAARRVAQRQDSGLLSLQRNPLEQRNSAGCSRYRAQEYFARWYREAILRPCTGRRCFFQALNDKEDAS